MLSVNIQLSMSFPDELRVRKRKADSGTGVRKASAANRMAERTVATAPKQALLTHSRAFMFSSL